MLIDTLHQLEQLQGTDNATVGLRLGSLREGLETRGWIKPVGFLSFVDVECFADEEVSVEVVVDEEAGVYRYRSPERYRLMLERPLTDITRYRFQIDAFFDYVTEMLGIEPRFKGRRRILVPGHLWYLGDVRVGGGHVFAPIFFGRLLRRAPREVLEASLADPALISGGVVLALSNPQLILPNRHQVRALSDLLIFDDDVERIDREMLDRILIGLPADSQAGEEWFDDKNGRLKLKHLEAPVMFKDIQAKVIEIFWQERDGVPLAWTEDVMVRSGSASPTLDKAMGGKARREQFIEAVSRGKFRLRRS